MAMRVRVVRARSLTPSEMLTRAFRTVIRADAVSDAPCGTRRGNSSPPNHCPATPNVSSCRVAVEHAPSVRADVDPPEDLGVAGDLQHQPPLVGVVVDALPLGATVDRAEDAVPAVHRADEVQRGFGRAWGG